MDIEKIVPQGLGALFARVRFSLALLVFMILTGYVFCAFQAWVSFDSESRKLKRVLSSDDEYRYATNMRPDVIARCNVMYILWAVLTVYRYMYSTERGRIARHGKILVCVCAREGIVRCIVSLLLHTISFSASIMVMCANRAGP